MPNSVTNMAYESMRGKLGESFGFKLNESGKVTDRKTVVCKKCGKSFCYTGSTSSLQYHLKHIHPFQSVTASIKGTTSSSSQSTLDNLILKPVSSIKETEITNKLVKWIVRDSRPVNIVSDRGLEEVLQEALNSDTYHLPSRDTVTKKIEKLYDVERSKLLGELKQAEFVSLTGDFWSSISNRSYLGVTAHWIDSNWEYRNSTLQVKHFTENHSAANCTEEFQNVFREWGLEDKVVAVCTDNARNIVLGVERAKYDNFRCAAHTLQLSLNKAIKDAGIEALLSKCRKIVGHFKHSPYLENQLAIKLKEQGLDSCKLKQDIVTRWNSTYFMFESLMKAKRGIIDVLTTHSSNIRLPTTTEWEMIEKMIVCLKPCLEISELLGGSKYVTVSVVLPAVTHLKSSLRCSDVDPGYIARFKRTLTDDLITRVNDWCNLNVYQEATALDPRFKYLRCIGKNDRESVWKRILERGVGGVQVPVQQCSKKRKLNFETEEDEQDSSHATPVSSLSSLAMEIEVYRSLAELEDDFADPLQWWKIHSVQLPHLARIAKKLLCIPATSVPCERVFSDAGNIVTKRRAALSSQHVNLLTCLKSWSKEA